MPVAAILPVVSGVISLLPSLTVGVNEAIGFVEKIRAALSQTGEWPADVDDAYRAALIAKALRPELQPDPK